MNDPLAKWKLPDERPSVSVAENAAYGRRALVARASETPRGFAYVMAGAVALLCLGHAISSLFDQAPTTDTIKPGPALEQASGANALDTSKTDVLKGGPQAPYTGSEKAPPLDASAPIDPPVAPPTSLKTEQLTLKRRETLSGLLERAGVPNRDAFEAIHALGDVADLRRLRPGQSVALAFRDSEDRRSLEAVSLRDRFDSHAVANRSASGFVADRKSVGTLPLARMIEGTIDDSLYLAARREGVPDKIILDVIRMMSYTVDFQRDIRKGDRFRIYFERAYAPDYGDVEEGRVLFAELALARGTFEAALFAEADGRLDYYDAKGRSLRKTLMLTPVDGARLSGSFGRRKHPVLGYTKLHKGLDFAAPRGTPIMAAGDGVVERANRYGSFGNYVRIRHGGGYKTAYAHLNGFAKGLKAGTRVKQGEVIGYIGSTGRSTGPHLHYEVHKGGRQVNPMKLDLPTARTLDGQERLKFERIRAVLEDDMQKLGDQNVALAVAKARPSGR